MTKVFVKKAHVGCERSAINIMKKYLKILFVLVSSSVVFISCSKNEEATVEADNMKKQAEKPIVVSLNVQASTLFALSNPTQVQIDQFCVFSDNNNGFSPNGTHNDFTSIIYQNSNVKWIGVTNAKGFTVAINSIAFKSTNSDVDFFGDTVLVGSGGSSGNVSATVKNNSSFVNKSNSYLITFTVYDNKGNFKTFSIDPKLAINQ